MSSAGMDAERLRATLGHYASGLTVIGGIDDGKPIGFTCQAFYSVSIDPPLISFSVMKSSTTYPRIRESGTFSVNVLSHDQRHISSQFARTGADKWNGIRWSATRRGNPVIAETLIWLDCEIWAEHEAGDHFIVIGLVKELSPIEWHVREPLLYFRGEYHLLRKIEDRSS